jgi:5'-methylthioadenosine phosphorylase
MGKLEVAVIGGSGFYQPEMFTGVREERIDTPYGAIDLIIAKLHGTELAFLPRHGKEHSLLPHQLNYRANLWGLKSFGIRRVIATTAVGGVNPEFAPGSLALIDQFIDFTKQRPLTFFESGEVQRAHIDMTEPYCPEIRNSLKRTADRLGIKIFNGGCYVCTEGPRYETPAEIRAFKILGGDVAGMTTVPEVVLARELGLCYANISIITNWAAGIGGKLSHSEVVAVMGENQETLRRLIAHGLRDIPAASGCQCSQTDQKKPD